MASGYLARYRTTRDAIYLSKAEACLDWLDHHKARKFEKHSWSNHFDFASRGGSYTSEDPIIVWTALIGFAYIEAYELTGATRWIEIADSVCALDHGSSSGKDRSRRLHQLPGACAEFDPQLQHARRRDARQYFEKREIAIMLMWHVPPSNTVARVSAPTAPVWYGEDPNDHWIDNFHTGYNLDSLWRYIASTGDDAWRPSLRRGLDFYKRNFFEDNGCPKYYHNRRYPVDSQCAAQSSNR